MQPKRMIRMLAALASLAACASAPPPQKQPFPTGSDEGEGSPATAAAEAPPPKTLTAKEVASLDPKAYAAKFPRPIFCEQAARKLQKVSREKAWEVLKACVDKGKFTLVNELTDGGWDEDFKSRPDAALYVAKVCAARGGDVVGDLGKFRQRKVPIFSLEAATRQPDIYKGRLLILRANVQDIRTQGSRATARLIEKGFTSYDKTFREAGTYAYNSWGYEKSTNRKMFFNEQRETGLEALGRLPSADPFLEPGKDFIVLGRFDGMRDTPSDGERESEKLAVLTVMSYFEPNPSLVE